ncbi:MAG: leucine-rich repeat domain-containing protein, partial [Muribaculaceae bacterium]|nr:leucine-rich repeat domain-containing protein [Muribaculaceae bacterium]
MFKKIIGVLTVTALLAAFDFSVTVCADTAPQQTGSCGSGVTFTLTDTNGDGNYDFLLIEGTGAMDNYADITDRPYFVQTDDEYGGRKVNRHIKEVHIDEGVTSVGDMAFINFLEIESVLLPSTLKEIGDNSLGGTALREITLPEGLECIGEHAFETCENLTAVYMPDSLKTIGGYAFRDCFALASIEIPNGVETIGDYAFHMCGSLTSIEVPNSVQSVGSRAFFGCESLTQLIYPSGLGCGSFTPSAATIEYSVNDDGKVVIDKISLGDGMTDTAVPDTVCGVPVAGVAESYRQLVSQTGHNHVDESGATCTQAAICAICGEYGSALGHSGGRATCTEKAVCTVCAAEYGEVDPNNHDFADGKCTRCQADDPDYVQPTEPPATESETAVTTTAPTYRPSSPAPAVTAVTTVTTVTTEEEIIADEPADDDVSSGALLAADGNVIPEKSACLMVIVAIAF